MPPRPRSIAATTLAAAIAAGAAIAQQQRTVAPVADTEARSAGTRMLALSASGDVALATVAGIQDGAMLIASGPADPDAHADHAIAAVFAASRGVRPALGVGATGRDLPAHDDQDLSRRRLAASQAGTLTLTDGQRFPGTLDAEETSADDVRWRHPELGVFSVPIDRVATIRIGPPGRPHAATPTADVLTLTNGDRLTGFVASLGPGVTIETDAGVVDVPTQRVASVALANPAQPMRGSALWLDDGTVLRVRDARAEPGGAWTVGLTDGGSTVIDSLQIRAAAADAARLTPLSAVQPISQSARGAGPLGGMLALAAHRDDALLAEAPTLGALDLLIDGAGRAVYELPAGTARLVATARLQDPDADAAVLALRAAGDERLRITLHRDAPAAAINIDAAGGDLEIVVEPAQRGRTAGAVRLERPLLIAAP